MENQFRKYADKMWTDPKDGAKHLIISKDQLQVGHYYLGSCRNAQIARWDGVKFWHWRTKWGDRFTESIFHPEDDNGFDLFLVREWLCENLEDLEIPLK